MRVLRSARLCRMFRRRRLRVIAPLDIMGTGVWGVDRAMHHSIVRVGRLRRLLVLVTRRLLPSPCRCHLVFVT